MTTGRPRHPIGVVADRTGLSPDVLRVWERRYGVVEPTRSAGGQRLYSDADIERLALLHRATQGGHGISHVATLAPPALEDLVREIETRGTVPASQAKVEAHPVIAEAFTLSTRMNPSALESLLRRNLARYGIVSFLDEIAAPFLKEVGDGWHAGTVTVSQEHLATAVVEKVVGDIPALLTDGTDNPSIIFATMEGERHSAGALMAAATAASEAWNVIYLGADLEADEIRAAAERTGARAVGVSIVATDRKSRLASQIRALEDALPSGVTLLVGGAGSRGMRSLIPQTKAIFLENLADLTQELAAIRLLSR
jgi:methanogenic corrinoid protein MtbC1